MFYVKLDASYDYLLQQQCNERSACRDAFDSHQLTTISTVFRRSHPLLQIFFLTNIGLTPSESRDVSTHPGFVSVDFQTTPSWVFLKEKLGLSSYEVAKVLYYVHDSMEDAPRKRFEIGLLLF